MRNHVIACAALASVSLFGCGAQGGDAEGQENLVTTAPLSVTPAGVIQSPPGDYNSFRIVGIFETPDCEADIDLYGSTGPLGVRVEDCPECLLPSQVEIGEPIEGFDMFACLAGVQECDVYSDVRGLTMSDLVYEQPVCGKYVAPTSFFLEFAHLDTTEPEADRQWIYATSEFGFGEDGTVYVVSDWQIGPDDGEL